MVDHSIHQNSAMCPNTSFGLPIYVANVKSDVLGTCFGKDALLDLILPHTFPVLTHHNKFTTMYGLNSNRRHSISMKYEINK
jgi:hypothetical protein